jgi:hypothetical protein
VHVIIPEPTPSSKSMIGCPRFCDPISSTRRALHWCHPSEGPKATKFSVLLITIADIAIKFPVLLRRELGEKRLIWRANIPFRRAPKPGIGEIPCSFPC